MRKARKGNYSRWFRIRKIGRKALGERSAQGILDRHWTDFPLQAGCRVGRSGEVVGLSSLYLQDVLQTLLLSYT
jgi:hypothetical protein